MELIREHEFSCQLLVVSYQYGLLRNPFSCQFYSHQSSVRVLRTLSVFSMRILRHSRDTQLP